MSWRSSSTTSTPLSTIGSTRRWATPSAGRDGRRSGRRTVGVPRRRGVGRGAGRDDTSAVTAIADPDQPLLLFYTAAFSGHPNAAMLSHRALLAQGKAAGGLHGGRPRPTAISAPGRCSTWARSCSPWPRFVAGGANVFVRRNEGEDIVPGDRPGGCTGGYVVGPMGAEAAEANRDGRWDLSTFRGARATPTSTPWCSPTAQPWGRRPGGYGQTEVVGMATFNLLAPDGIGRARQAVAVGEMRVVGPDGRGRPAARPARSASGAPP